MEIPPMLEHAQESFTVKRVFGEPYVEGDVTIIPSIDVVPWSTSSCAPGTARRTPISAASRHCSAQSWTVHTGIVVAH